MAITTSPHTISILHVRYSSMAEAVGFPLGTLSCPPEACLLCGLTKVRRTRETNGFSE